MTAPNIIAKCAGRCAEIAPASTYEKLGIAFAIVLLGVVVLAAIVALLETPSRRHALFHFFLPSVFCSRCLTEQNAKADDRAFDRSNSHSALSQEIEAPR